MVRLHNRTKISLFPVNQCRWLLNMFHWQGQNFNDSFLLWKYSPFGLVGGEGCDWKMICLANQQTLHTAIFPSSSSDAFGTLQCCHLHIWKSISSPYRLLVLLVHWSKYPCSWLPTQGSLWQWLMATLSQEEWLTPTCEYWRRYKIYLLYYLFWEADVCPHFYSWNKHSDIFWQVRML